MNASSLARKTGGQAPKGPAPTAAKPSRIGRFEIVEEIGTGSMGVVYLARDPMIGRWVAVKKLTGIKGKELDLETVRRLLINEARNVGALEHPNILTVFDIIENDAGKVEALAMEYVGGRSLRQRLDDTEPLSLKYISEILTAVAEALDYAHGQGCVHRDVKPANVLLGVDGSIKIADFGIAALRGEDLATELKNLGTPNYLAPERVMGQPGDQLTDIYSLGVILYELLTRRLPFEATSIAELVQKIVRDEPPPPERFAPGLMPGLKRILERSMAKDPADRYRSAGALAAAVREIVEAQANLNQTVPTPQVEPVPAPAPVPSSEPSDGSSREAATAAADEVAREVLSPLPAILEVPAVPAPSPAQPPEVEEVEWKDRGRRTIADSLAGVLASVGRLGAVWLARVARAGRRLRASRHQPVLVAAAVFVVVLPLLALAFRPGSPVPEPDEGVSGYSVDSARRQALGLIVESRRLLQGRDEKAARAALHQAELLFPLEPEAGASRKILAAQREVDRLERVDSVTRRAQSEIARADFDRARASIASLRELGAAADVIRRLEYGLRQGRARLEARRIREAQPEPRAPTTARQTVPRRRVAVARPVPSGPGTLEIEFASERSRGVLTVFADDVQVLNRPYRFVEKKKFLLRKGVGGSFREAIELPEGVRNLRVYLTQPRQKTQYRPMQLEIEPGKATSLRLRVDGEGRLVVASG